MGATSEYASDLSRQIAANNPAGALLSVAKAIYSFGRRLSIPFTALFIDSLVANT